MLTDEEKLDVLYFAVEETIEHMVPVYPWDDDYSENLPILPNDDDEDAENGTTGST